MKRGTLFLGIFRREPGYVHGEIKLGLYEAKDKDEAREKMIDAIGGTHTEVSRGEISLVELNGEPAKLMTLPTDYRDD